MGLVNHVLGHYKSDKDEFPFEMFVLTADSCITKASEEEVGTILDTNSTKNLYHFCLHLNTEELILLRAETSNELQSWVSTLRKCIYNLRELDRWRRVSVDILKIIFRVSSFEDRLCMAVVCKKWHQAHEQTTTALSFSTKYIADVNKELVSKILKKYVNVNSLNFCNCYHMESETLEEVGALKRLKRLDLQACRTVTDQALLHLIRLPLLQKLSLQRCQAISDLGLTILSNCVKLKYLDLGGCNKITDKGINDLLPLTKLRLLNLWYCTLLTDISLQLVSTFKKLEVLIVTGCSLMTPDGFKCLAKSKYLSIEGLVRKRPQKRRKKKITVYEPFKPSEVQQEEAPISGNVVVKTDQ